LGNTAVFLIGGETKEEPPTAMYIRSGDVVIMGGKSRQFYHGVPRIIEGTCPIFYDNKEPMPPSSKLVNDILLTGRLNMNVRQVLGEKKKFPNCLASTLS